MKRIPNHGWSAPVIYTPESSIFLKLLAFPCGTAWSQGCPPKTISLNTACLQLSQSHHFHSPRYIKLRFLVPDVCTRQRKQIPIVTDKYWQYPSNPISSYTEALHIRPRRVYASRERGLENGVNLWMLKSHHWRSVKRAQRRQILCLQS
jgi:hypothetical protein